MQVLRSRVAPSAGNLSASGPFVVGVDVGTGGCKVTVLGREGVVHGTAYVAYPSRYERSGWVEQDPDQWVRAAYEGVAQVLSRLSSGQRQEVRLRADRRDGADVDRRGLALGASGCASVRPAHR